MDVTEKFTKRRKIKWGSGGGGGVHLARLRPIRVRVRGGEKKKNSLEIAGYGSLLKNGKPDT